MKQDMNLNIRFPRTMWNEYLRPMDNYSEFCRDAILEKIEKRFSDQFADQQIQCYQNKIKELKERKKLNQEIPKKANAILQKWYESFKSNDRMMNEDRFNWRWIEDQIIPELEPLGCKLTKNEILSIFQDHIREGKVMINVG